MKRTMIVAALLGALLTGAPASADTTFFILGAGQISASQCFGETGAVVLEGIHGPGNVWTFAAQPIGICLVPPVMTGVGAWNPATGGCVALPPVWEICVGPMPQLTPVQVDVTFYSLLTGDMSGKITAVRF